MVHWKLLRKMAQLFFQKDSQLNHHKTNMTTLALFRGLKNLCVYSGEQGCKIPCFFVYCKCQQRRRVMEKHFTRCASVTCRKPLYVKRKLVVGEIACCNAKCVEHYHQQQDRFAELLKEWQPNISQKALN